MNLQHADLGGGRWAQLSFMEQMAHVGGEVERALLWRERGNADYSRRAYERALELLSLTIDQAAPAHSIRELTRLRELLTDAFHGANAYGSTPEQWRRYFNHFAFAVRRDH